MNILSFLQNVFFRIYHFLIFLFYKLGGLLSNIISETNYNIEHLPLHLCLILLIIGFSIIIYIKLTYPFWNTQPVFHTYDFWRYWYTTPFLIQSGYPAKTRFCKFKEIHTFRYLEIDEIQKKYAVNLIQSFTIPDESAIHMFHLDNLDKYMTGQSYSSYISFYYQDTFDILPKKITPNPFITDSTFIERIQKPIGCITSRLVELWITGIKYPMYFLDFIILHREKVERGLSRELIQTHEYRQRQQSLDDITKEKPAIQISIFKKEVDLCKGIVPLIQYESSMFFIRNDKISALPPHFILVEIHRRNIQLLWDFLETIRPKYKCFGMPELPNLTGLVHSGILRIYLLQKGSKIYSVYFFRDSRTEFENKGALLVLIASIQNTHSDDLFYTGFLWSLNKILKKTPIFKLLLIERISQNPRIYERYNSANEIGEISAAYYLYNFIIPQQPFLREEVLLCF